MAKGSSRKFAAQADELAASIELMFVAAIREGITRGFREAVANTVQDSSNAAAHWMIGIEGRGNIYSRKFGKLVDLRGQGHSLVGKRGDNRGSGALAESVINAVIEREVQSVINKYVKGQRPELGFFFYNAVASDEEYDYNALVSEAGRYGVEFAQKYFEREIALGNVRRNRLKGGN